MTGYLYETKTQKLSRIGSALGRTNAEIARLTALMTETQRRNPAAFQKATGDLVAAEARADVLTRERAEALLLP